MTDYWPNNIWQYLCEPRLLVIKLDGMKKFLLQVDEKPKRIEEQKTAITELHC